MVDLALLVDLTGSGFKELNDAWDINSRGDILGSVLDASGRSLLFILTPVPEPASWIVAGAGLLVLFGLRTGKSLREKLGVRPILYSSSDELQTIGLTPFTHIEVLVPGLVREQKLQHPIACGLPAAR